MILYSSFTQILSKTTANICCDSSRSHRHVQMTPHQNGLEREQSHTRHTTCPHTFLFTLRYVCVFLSLQERRILTLRVGSNRTSGVLHHVRDLSWSRFVCCNDQVSFVLTILVVQNEHKLPSSNSSYAVFDAVELLLQHRVRQCIRYFRLSGCCMRRGPVRRRAKSWMGWSASLTAPQHSRRTVLLAMSTREHCTNSRHALHCSKFALRAGRNGNDGDESSARSHQR